jgi:hypothetical protein
VEDIVFSLFFPTLLIKVRKNYRTETIFN